ncbi:BON domain-containing protein [Jannaschia sp. R86511]|uniref:BON domain-containing protein n=1 Tax=Jannaschia sp. R86511 TaxID=3093853 RepID=UPI0036D37C8B
MTQTLHPSTHLLKTQVVDELTWTPEVNADHIGVAVTDGAVTLSGEVTSYSEKAAAVRAAMRLRGVTAVADDIVIQHPYGERPDTEVAADAATALTRIPGAGDVKAEVSNRWITLTGHTTWHYQRQTAVRAAEAVRGVAGVTSLITIFPDQAFSAAAATANITAALQRNATVDAHNIHVSADGSTIELTGHVSSWAELRQATHAAYATPGVTHVRNQLRVTP